MRHRAASPRGFALLMVLLALAGLVIVASTVTIFLAGLVDRSARFERETRARALAEAGVECALSRPEAAQTLTILLDGGQCRFSVQPVSNQPDRLRVTSDGAVKSGRNRMVVGIELVLEKPRDAEGPLRVVSRREYLRMEPAGG